MAGASCSSAGPVTRAWRLAAGGRVARQPRRRQLAAPCASQQPKERQQTDPKAPDPGLGLKAVWVGAEQLGNLLGLAKGPGSSSRKQTTSSEAAQALAPLSREQALAAIRRDYDENYFISGRGEMEAYADDCLFADPFAGFRGVERFKRNVSNLGGLMSDVSLELTDWREEEGGETSAGAAGKGQQEGEGQGAPFRLQTKWRFRCVLDLPWRPVLAAAGGTTHVFDEATGRCTQHIEAWDVNPGQVVRGLLKPSANVPTNRWEVLFSALHAGNPKMVWFAVSGGVLQAALVAGGVDLAARLALHDGSSPLPGWAEAALLAVVLGCTVTEGVKFTTGGIGE